MLHMSLKLVIMYIIPRAMFVKVWPSTFKIQLLSTTNQNVHGPVGYASTKYKLGLIITLVCSETYLCTGIWILMNVKWPVNLVCPNPNLWPGPPAHTALSTCLSRSRPTTLNLFRMFKRCVYVLYDVECPLLKPCHIYKVCLLFVTISCNNLGYTIIFPTSMKIQKSLRLNNRIFNLKHAYSIYTCIDININSWSTD